jgi:hypothetical protein
MYAAKLYCYTILEAILITTLTNIQPRVIVMLEILLVMCFFLITLYASIQSKENLFVNQKALNKITLRR